MEGERFNAHALARTLSALATPARLGILRELRSQKALQEIRVLSDPAESESGPSHLLSRQAVKQHLDRLIEIGVVVVHHPAASDRARYLVDHRRLYAIAEEFRVLATLRPEEDLEAAPTQPRPPHRAKPGSPGPRLVIVRGLGEGKTFPLTPDGGSLPCAWVVGRKRDADVPLDYDLYVSWENSLVEWAPGQGYRVRDLAGSRNGTSVNFEPLPPAGSHALEHGDLVGVGQSTLAFWDH